MCRLSRQFAKPVEQIDISSDELALQIAYERHHPSLDFRLEFMLAQLIALLVKIYSKPGARVDLGDFMLSEMMRDKPSVPTDLDTQIRATFSLFRKK